MCRNTLEKSADSASIPASRTLEKLAALIAQHAAAFAEQMRQEYPELPTLIELYPEIARLSLADLFAHAQEAHRSSRLTIPEPSNAEVKS